MRGVENGPLIIRKTAKFCESIIEPQNLAITLNYRYSIVKTGKGVKEFRMPRIIIEGYRCQRCNHHWAPRNGTGYRDKEDPKTCPKCKSPYWNKPRINQARIPIMVESGATPHVKLEGYQCDRCGHRWSPPDGTGRWSVNNEDPKQCPKCRSPYWNKPRQRRIHASRTAAQKGLIVTDREKVA